MPLANIWIFWGLLMALCLTVYNVLFRLAGNVNPFLFLAIANAVGLICYAVSYFMTKDQIELNFTDKTWLWAVLVGLMIVGSEVGLFFMLKNSNAGLSLGCSAVYVLNIFLTALIGILAFKEQITWQNALGIAFGLLSVWLLTYKQGS